jgi:hypothetical protein
VTTRAYGDFNDGYWGNDGLFWFSDAANSWYRDDAHHRLAFMWAAS